MKLFYTPNSCYARKVRVLARERSLMDRITEVKVTVRDPKSDLLKLGPVGRVPELLFDDGTLLGESSLICAYLDELHQGPKVVPAGEDRWTFFAFEAEALGFMDGVAVWCREARRPKNEQSPSVLELERMRADRCLDVLESTRAGAMLRAPLHIGQLTVGCALGLVDKWFPDLGWRDGRPSLSSWYEQLAARPSMIATRPEP